MTKQEIITLFDFDRWATERVLDVAATLSEGQYTKNLNSSFGGVRGTLVHIYAADWIWLERWKGNSPTTLIREEDLPNLASLRERWIGWRSQADEFLHAVTEEQLQSPLSYSDIRGNPHTQILWQQLQHLINHSTYHRGQVITLFRQLGIKGVGTDLINYYRLKARNA
ncbi:MAG: DinB family protein [Bacteroidota bacterium]